MRTLVTFRSSAFNTTERTPDFLNDDNFGRDVAGWLASELERQGHNVDHEIGQEDHGWYFTFSAGGDQHDFIVGYRDNDGPEWIGWAERSLGLLRSMFGARHRNIDPAVVRAVHEVLSASERVTEIRWHEESLFTHGVEDQGTGMPTGSPTPRSS